MSTMTAVIRQDHEGDRFWFAGGGLWTMKAAADETGGSMAVWEVQVARGKTTPLHLHPDFDETIYVLEGEMLVHIDGDEQSVGAGGLAFLPRGVPHALLTVSETARLLAVMAPGTAEAFYRDILDPSTSDADASRPADIDRLREAAMRSDHIELLGPPPFEAG